MNHQELNAAKIGDGSTALIHPLRVGPCSRAWTFPGNEIGAMASAA